MNIGLNEWVLNSWNSKGAIEEMGVNERECELENGRWEYEGMNVKVNVNVRISVSAGVSELMTEWVSEWVKVSK